MGPKRNKIKIGIRTFIPETVNFSELEKKVRITYGMDKGFDIGDDNDQMDKLEQKIQFEEMIIQTLSNLEGKEQIIFVYQLLRDLGYQIDHESFAHTLRINRNQYMNILKIVRIKTFLMVEGYKNSLNKRRTNGIL